MVLRWDSSCRFHYLRAFICCGYQASPGGASGEEPACQCRRFKRPGFGPWVRKIPLRREGMATHSSIRAWRIPWTEEPGSLRSIGSQRIRHNWSDLALAYQACLLLAVWLWMSNFSFSICKWGCIKINTVPQHEALSWGLNKITSRGSPRLMEWNQLQMRLLLGGKPSKVSLLQVCWKQWNGSDFLWSHPVLLLRPYNNQPFVSRWQLVPEWASSSCCVTKKKKKRLPVPKD